MEEWGSVPESLLTALLLRRQDGFSGFGSGLVCLPSICFLFLCGHPEACLSKESDWWRHSGRSTIKIHGRARLQHYTPPPLSLSLFVRHTRQRLFTLSGLVMTSDGTWSYFVLLLVVCVCLISLLSRCGVWVSSMALHAQSK